MDLAFGISRLVPAGGLERLAIRLAEIMIARGHAIAFYTTAGMGTVPAGSKAIAIERRGWTNHGSLQAFAADFTAAARGRHDLVVGFQKYPGLDVLFCADWCYAERSRSFLYRLLPRHRTMVAMERACFAPDSKTKLVLLARSQADSYVAAHGTPRERIAVMPPTLDPRLRAPAPPDAARRAALRARHGLAPDALVWMWVGLQPRVKGLDRVFAALASRPEVTLVICGVDASHREAARLMRSAAGLADRVRIFGLTKIDMLAELYAASDLLVHPARLEVTGMAILEAMAGGLPVVVTANCGNAVHVAAANGGVVVPAAFDQAHFEAVLRDANAQTRAQWSRNAYTYGARPDLYSGLERACDLFEIAGRRDEGAWAAAAAASAGGHYA